MRQVIAIVFFGLFVISSFFCGIRVYEHITAESYINGSLNVSNVFVLERFEYSSDGLVFYEDLNSSSFPFYYNVQLINVDDFDGIENNYEIYLNDYLLYNTEINAGYLVSNLVLDFYDINGDLIISSNLQIKVEFLNDRTELYFYSDDYDESVLLSQYFSDNGLLLEIKGV